MYKNVKAFYKHKGTYCAMRSVAQPDQSSWCRTCTMLNTYKWNLRQLIGLLLGESFSVAAHGTDSSRGLLRRSAGSPTWSDRQLLRLRDTNARWFWSRCWNPRMSVCVGMWMQGLIASLFFCLRNTVHRSIHIQVIRSQLWENIF